MGHDVDTSRADFLFAQPSLAGGIGRLFDLWGWFDLYNISLNGRIADTRALTQDWRCVGTDLRRAMRALPRPRAQGTLFSECSTAASR